MTAAGRDAGEAAGTAERLEAMRFAQLLEAVAARRPAPGGGAVASLVAALGAALARMVLSFSLDRPNLREHADLHIDAGRRLQELSARALDLAALDATVSARMIELWKLAKDDPRRRAAWDGAVQDAIAAPQQVLDTAREVLEVTEELVGRTNRLLGSDLAIAAILAEAAARAAAWNVHVNLPQLDDAPRARTIAEHVARLLEDVHERCSRIERAIR